MDLKANTAVDVLIGPFVDSTDGNTTEDALTISQADVKLSKNGQSLAQKNDATACAFDDDGYYNCELDATDLNTEGSLALIVHESGALPVRHEYNVLSEAAWDSMYAAKDDGFMDVNIKTIGRADTQETEATNLEAAAAAYSATRGLSGTALPAFAADAGGGLPISIAGSLDLDAMDANVTTLLGRISATLFNGITSLRQWLGCLAHNNADNATALSEINASGSGGGGYDQSAHSQEAIGDNVSNIPTESVIADSVWDEAQSGHTTAGTFGKYLDTEVSGVGGGSAASIADAVWDEALSGHTGAGSAGKSLADTEADATLIVADTDELQTDWTNAGRLDTLLDACKTIADDWTNGGRLDLILDAIKVISDDWTNGGRLDLILDIIAADTTTDIPTLIAALKDFDPAADTVAHVTLCDTITTYTGNTKQTADNDTRLTAIQAITDAMGATAAANFALALGASGVVTGAAVTGTLSTTVMTTDLSETTDDHYIGRIIVWTSGDLAGQATDITDYSGTNGTCTFTAVTEAPSNTDAFIIV
ncbi:MAG: hypothetical protein GY720_15970 [bacterium]|nr:hypothetical protein [bacterium]